MPGPDPEESSPARVGAAGQAAPDGVVDVVVASASEIAGEPLEPATDVLEAGFDSLFVVQLAALLTERLGVTCSFEDAFDAPSLDALATVLRNRLA
jgi:acyl carrier protein